ncbi:MAG: hypothetical protein DMG88_12330 [Acidobacteria bacterium]|nr:MAG: hypothetical protein DMG88_12330 [Acidobacteriota bacterium]
MFDSSSMHVRLVVRGVFLAITVATYAQTQGMKDFGNRLEGTNVHLDALEDFTLIAVHRNFTTFSRNANLNVRFFLPRLPGNPKKNVFVEAVELQDSFHYFMQSKSSAWNDDSWNIFANWPTKDVIDPLELHADNVGVLARYQIENSRPVYLPVDVYQNGGRIPEHPYAFYFVTGQDLQSLDVSVTNAAGAAISGLQKTLQCKRNFNPNCRLYAAGSTQELDLDMSSLAAGEYHVKLVGHVPGTSTPTSLDIVIYHHP